MSFKCYDYFMIRFPSLPISYLYKYRKQEKDIYNFIKEDKYLDYYFKKSLLISSSSLYNSYISTPKTHKKYNNLLSSLLKFFIRSTTRTTPYGYFSAVSLAKFDIETDLVLDKNIFDIRLDSDFVDFLVKCLEDRYFSKFKFKYNKNCYISGDLYKNPYLTNIRNKSSEETTMSTSIRYTNLISVVKNNTKDFMAFEDLKKIIENNYKGIDETLVVDTLKSLIDNEYLYSDLRIPSYCLDNINFLIEKLDNYGIYCTELTDLKAIKNHIDNFKISEDLIDIIKIYEIVDKYNKKDYLLFNLGNDLRKYTIGSEVKEILENFVDVLSYIPKELNYLKKFKDKFQEQYGFNVYVPLIEVIDENDFNGLDLVDEDSIVVKNIEKEEKVKNIINNKMYEAIIQRKNSVSLSKLDFKDFVKNEEYSKGFDLNFHIFKNKNAYKLYLGSNVGSRYLGSMFQRFSNCFSDKMLEKYNNIYKLVNDNYEHCLEVELREHGINKRIRNIINDTQVCKYFLNLGNCQEKDSNEIDINDLYIILTDTGKLLVKSKKYNKILRFVTNNMLNSEFGSKILKLLRYISVELEVNPIIRLLYFSNDFNYKYVPRIIIENIVVQLRQWNLNKEDLDSNTFNNFKNSLEKSIKNYKIENMVYACFFDNRLLIDLTREEDVNVLYNEFKKTSKLKLTEIEDELFSSNIVKNDSNNFYINECVFSFFNNEINNNSYSMYNYSNYYVNSIKNIIDDGWIYFKLYGINGRDNDILSRDIPNLLEKLKIKNHFFIRYWDKDGYHLRIRIKFSSRKEAIENLDELSLWAKELREKKLINNIMFDSYNREVNRYGGEDILELCEEQFFTNSVLVEKYLKDFDKKNEETYYIFTILFILKNIYSNIDEINNFLEKNNQNKEYHNQYIKRKREILGTVLDFLKDDMIFNNFQKELEKERKSLINIKIKLYKLNNKKQREDLVRSLVHMACNRLTGNNLIEDKYFEFVKSAIKNIVEAKRRGVKII